MGFHRYDVVFADVPQQSEDFSNDSGITVMKNLELWDPSVSMMEKYCEADIPHVCIKYVNEMILNDFNSSDDCLSKVKEYDAEESTFKKATLPMSCDSNKWCKR
ncbi:uncharacterized protein [Miscanthus floridulus]|uniref:uncharacterized protein n=1 Tax=Miscanthus floridulus TaxID=154761 RepID=UPI00345A0090